MERKQIAFRLRPELIEQLHKEAKQESISLNNYVETILMRYVFHSQNKKTMQAIDEARSGKELETLDLSNLKKYVASL